MEPDEEDFSTYKVIIAEQNAKAKKWVVIGISILLAVIVLGMIGCPQYNVYKQRKEGEAALAHAQSSKEVAVAEAKAKMESAALLAQADTLRAHGTARSNEIIGASLSPQYLQWFWTNMIGEQQAKQIIYVPSGPFGVPVTEATRLQEPAIVPEKQ